MKRYQIRSYFAADPVMYQLEFKWRATAYCYGLFVKHICGHDLVCMVTVVAGRDVVGSTRHF